MPADAVLVLSQALLLLCTPAEAELVVSLQVAEATAKQIEVAAAAYKPCSVRAAILYFVLNDLAGVDPMYQFSLDAYNDLFLISIQKSAKFDKLDERIKSLNDYHTYAVYKYTSRSVQVPGSSPTFTLSLCLLCSTSYLHAFPTLLSMGLLDQQLSREQKDVMTVTKQF
jgi:hypothetical protein